MPISSRRSTTVESHKPSGELGQLQLNYSVCPLEKGQWVFGQLDLAEPLTVEYQHMEIRMKNLLTGRFSINEVYVDGRPVGAMRFIVGAP